MVISSYVISPYVWNIFNDTISNLSSSTNSGIVISPSYNVPPQSVPTTGNRNSTPVRLAGSSNTLTSTGNKVKIIIVSNRGK